MPQGLTIVCDKRKVDGTVCGATAVVVRASYEYENIDFTGAGDCPPRLVEARYEVVCPQCGPRRQIERIE